MLHLTKKCYFDEFLPCLILSYLGLTKVLCQSHLGVKRTITFITLLVLRVCLLSDRQQRPLQYLKLADSWNQGMKEIYGPMFGIFIKHVIHELILFIFPPPPKKMF